MKIQHFSHNSSKPTFSSYKAITHYAIVQNFSGRKLGRTVAQNILAEKHWQTDCFAQQISLNKNITG